MNGIRPTWTDRLGLASGDPVPIRSFLRPHNPKRTPKSMLVSNATILLISADQRLITTIREVVESIGNLSLSLQERVEDAQACLQRRQASLVLYHLASGAT